MHLPPRHPALRWVRFILGMTLVTVLLAGGMTALQAQRAQASAQTSVASVVETPLPESVDLTQWTVPAGAQGTVGACVSWAIAHNIMGWYANKLGSPTTFAPMYIYSQTHLSDDLPDGGGSMVRTTTDLINQQGVATLNSYQPQGDYNFKDKPTTAQTENAATYKMQPVVPIYGASVYSPKPISEGIKRALAAGTPVGIMIPLYPGFYNLDKTHALFSAADVSGSSDGYHYLAAFGYDATGVWVENSWGQSWGSNGFARLTWDFIAKYAPEAEAYPGFIATSLPYVKPPVASVPTPTATPTQVAPAPAPLPALPSVVRKLHTLKRAKSAIRISWQAPANTTRVYGYWLTLTSKRYGNERSLNLSGTQHTLTLGKLRPGTTYRVSIVAVNARGLGKHVAHLNVKTLARR